MRKHWNHTVHMNSSAFLFSFFLFIFSVKSHFLFHFFLPFFLLAVYGQQVMWSVVLMFGLCKIHMFEVEDWKAAVCYNCNHGNIMMSTGAVPSSIDSITIIGRFLHTVEKVLKKNFDFWKTTEVFQHTLLPITDFSVLITSLTVT